jgi:hypothetical protein
LIGGQGSDVFIEINRECKYVTQQLKYTFNEPWVASLVQLGTDFIAWAINMTWTNASWSKSIIIGNCCRNLYRNFIFHATTDCFTWSRKLFWHNRFLIRFRNQFFDIWQKFSFDNRIPFHQVIKLHQVSSCLTVTRCNENLICPHDLFHSIFLVAKKKEPYYEQKNWCHIVRE